MRMFGAPVMKKTYSRPIVLVEYIVCQQLTSVSIKSGGMGSVGDEADVKSENDWDSIFDQSYAEVE